MFGQFSGFSPSSRPMHVGIDKRLFQQRSSLGHSSSNLRARWHIIAEQNRSIFLLFWPANCFLLVISFFFATLVEGIWLISYSLKQSVCNLADMHVFSWSKYRRILSHKAASQATLNVPPILKYTTEFREFWHQCARICEDFRGKLALNFFFVAKVFCH